MPTLTGCTPYFEVFDMIDSVRFYRELLGFEVEFASPEVETAEGRFPHYVRLRRGAAGLMLNTAYDSNERPADRREERWMGCRHIAIYVDCDDVDALYDECLARGLTASPPALTSYGFRAFSMQDPDGYGVIFHQPA